MATLYAASMVWLVGMIILWFWFDERKQRNAAAKVALLFGLGLPVYFFALFGSDGSLLHKLAVLLPRDALTLLVAIIVSGYIQKNRTFALTLLAFGFFSAFFYWDLLDRSIRTHEPGPAPTAATLFGADGKVNAAAPNDLDPTAELLVDLKVPDRRGGADQVAAFRRAFPMLQASRLLEGLSRPDATELDDYLTVDIPDAHLGKLEAIEAELAASPLVDEVERNERVTLHQAPSPSYGFNDPRATEQWALKALELQGYKKLVESLKPRKKVLLVVIDTGIQIEHEDLAGHYRSVDKTSDADGVGHGTHCAGIAGAVSDNRKGIASLAGGSDWFEIASVRVFEGHTTQAKVLEGMVKAADARADVVSMSLGGPSEPSRKLGYQRAVDYITSGGGIVVASAGNSNADARDFCPVNCTGVIGVSAIGPDKRRANFSNRVDGLGFGIAAPGVDILSTFPDANGATDTYRTLSGTSMSAPYVSGLVAMMKALRPKLTPQEAWTILHDTGETLKGGQETGRLIQPVRALKGL